MRIRYVGVDGGSVYVCRLDSDVLASCLSIRRSDASTRNKLAGRAGCILRRLEHARHEVSIDGARSPPV
jgi:hypothetical protein